MTENTKDLSRHTGGFSLPRGESNKPNIDLNDELMMHPNSTFLFRVGSDAMSGVGILKGDYVAVDRAVDAKHNRIVLAVVNNEHLIRRYDASIKPFKLVAENDEYRPIIPSEGMEIAIWGVVVSSFRKYFN